MIRCCASALLMLGLFTPGPTATRWNDDLLALPALFSTSLTETPPPDPATGGTAGCGGIKELRFGWIDDEAEARPLVRRGGVACLAVYPLPAAPRPALPPH